MLTSVPYIIAAAAAADTAFAGAAVLWLYMLLHTACSAATLPTAPANSMWLSGTCDGVTNGSVCNATCPQGMRGAFFSTCRNGT
jgi:hypothetical protein